MLEKKYRISSPISLVIFSVFDTEICKIFHQKWGSAYSQGFGIKKKLLNSAVLLSFWTTQVCLKVSKFRVSAYSRDRLIGEEIWYLFFTGCVISTLTMTDHNQLRVSNSCGALSDDQKFLAPKLMPNFMYFP